MSGVLVYTDAPRGCCFSCEAAHQQFTSATCIHRSFVYDRSPVRTSNEYSLLWFDLYTRVSFVQRRAVIKSYLPHVLRDLDSGVQLHLTCTVYRDVSQNASIQSSIETGLQCGVRWTSRPLRFNGRSQHHTVVFIHLLQSVVTVSQRWRIE